MSKSKRGGRVTLASPFTGIPVEMILAQDVTAVRDRLESLAARTEGLAFEAKRDEDRVLFGLRLRRAYPRTSSIGMTGLLLPVDDSTTRVSGRTEPDRELRPWALLMGVFALLGLLAELVGLSGAGLLALILVAIGVAALVVQMLAYLRNFKRVVELLEGSRPDVEEGVLR